MPVFGRALCKKSSGTLADPRNSALLWAYLRLSPILRLFARRHLERRIVRGKEDAQRYYEKLGQSKIPRPDGPLVWMHAVGVGEVLALPALIREMQRLDPTINLLLTSSTRTSAQAIQHNLPPRTIHQFLPLDSPHYVKRFLDHWQPQLSVWAERDIWPAFICEIKQRGIPMALINGRMSLASGDSKQKAPRFFAALYARFNFIEVQDQVSADQFARLGVALANISVTGSLKAGADALADQPERRMALQKALQNRPLWLAASTHPDDEIEVFKAHTKLLQHHPDTCLILAPRDPSRAKRIQKHARDLGFQAAILSTDSTNISDIQIAILDTVGQLGVWYRLADRCFVGGSFSEVGGHNPYEPALLDCAISHGPNVTNFADDYAAFHREDAVTQVRNSEELAKTLLDPTFLHSRQNANKLAKQGKSSVTKTAKRLLSLLQRQDT